MLLVSELATHHVQLSWLVARFTLSYYALVKTNCRPVARVARLPALPTSELFPLTYTHTHIDRHACTHKECNGVRAQLGLGPVCHCNKVGNKLPGRVCVVAASLPLPLFSPFLLAAPLLVNPLAAR